MSDSYLGAEKPASATSEYNALDFIVRQIMGTAATITEVQVRSVTMISDFEFEVDVQPMVHQIDGAGNVTPHGIVHGLPVIRIQGGAGAVVVVPAVGDIGAALFAREDNTNVRANRAPSPPGSRRRQSYADGLYLGGVLNQPPSTFLRINPDGTVVVVAPTSVTFTTPMVIMSGDLMVTQNIITGPDSTFNGKSFDAHSHSGVAAGSANTGPPV